MLRQAQEQLWSPTVSKVGKLSGTVVGRDGQAVAGLEVWGRPAGTPVDSRASLVLESLKGGAVSSQPSWSSDLSLSMLTDARGRFELQIPDRGGRYEVWVCTPGAGDQPRIVCGVATPRFCGASDIEFVIPGDTAPVSATLAG